LLSDPKSWSDLKSFSTQCSAIHYDTIRVLFSLTGCRPEATDNNGKSTHRPATASLVTTHARSRVVIHCNTVVPSSHDTLRLEVSATMTRYTSLVLWVAVCRLHLVVPTWGFVALPSLSSPRTALGPQVARYMSSPPSSDDDEIAKLRSRRSQIKRQKKDEAETAPPEPPEPVVDLDLDKLPEFKTERPVRGRKREGEAEAKGDDDEGDGKTSSKQKNDVAPIVDFMAEYEDENEFHIPNRIGVSTRAWGDPTANFVGSGKLTKRMIKLGKFVPGDLQLAYLKLLEGGITFIETSPVYGSASRKQKLSSEDILKRCLEEHADDLPEAMVFESFGQSLWTKVLSPSNAMVDSLEDSLSRLGTASVELFQAPRSLLFPSTLLANGLAAAIESGQCNNVGVQGVTRPGALRRLKNKLEAKEVSLTSNSFDFSLTNQKHENMIDACKDLGVIPIVTNPLDDGLASGVYTATNPSGGQQGGKAKFTFKELEKLQPLHSVQETVADRVRTRVIREMRDTQDRFRSKYGPPPKINTDITTTQVALNYVIAKGGVPLPEVNTPREAEEVLGSLGWTLNDEEVGMLDAAAALCRL